MADALEKLPADYREVFLLRNLEHIPFEVIAVANEPFLGRGANDLDPRDQEA